MNWAYIPCAWATASPIAATSSRVSLPVIPSLQVTCPMPLISKSRPLVESPQDKSEAKRRESRMLRQAKFQGSRLGPFRVARIQLSFQLSRS